MRKSPTPLFLALVEHRGFRILEGIILLPSTISLGFLALIGGVGGVFGGILGAISRYPELGIGIVFGELVWIALVFFMFILPAIGFWLLWSLLIRGPEATVANDRLCTLTLVIGVYAVGLAGWFILQNLDKANIWLAFGPPLFIGVLNLAGLMLARRQKQKDS